MSRSFRDPFNNQPSYFAVCKVAAGTVLQNMGWSLPENMAESLIKDLSLTLSQRRTDLTGETSALFEFEGTTLRLKHGGCPKRYTLHRGEWKPDPHWTGD